MNRTESVQTFLDKIAAETPPAPLTKMAARKLIEEKGCRWTNTRTGETYNAGGFSPATCNVLKAIVDGIRITKQSIREGFTVQTYDINRDDAVCVVRHDKLMKKAPCHRAMFYRAIAELESRRVIIRADDGYKVDLTALHDLPSRREIEERNAQTSAERRRLLRHLRYLNTKTKTQEVV